MRKAASDTFTAGMLRKSFKQTVKQLIAKRKTFNVLSTIKSTPVYGKVKITSSISNGKAVGHINIFCDAVFCGLKIGRVSINFFINKSITYFR